MPAAYKPSKEDRARVQLMAAGGMTQESIAKRMGMTDKTLREHFRQELDFGLSEINTLAIGQLVQQIRAGNMAAICFWLKCRAGWRETDRLEHIGEGGGPVILKVEYADNSIPE
jgi:DNA-binding Xre family transcriptional regulator